MPEIATAMLTRGQQGIWSIQNRFPGSSAYNCPVCIAIDGPVDVGLIEAACMTLPALHPALRTRVYQADGRLCRSFDREGVDFRIELPSSIALNAHQFMRDLVAKQFDMTKERLWRVHLVPQGETGVYLLFVVHHIIFDGTSAYLLTKSFLDAYRNLVQGSVQSGRATKASPFLIHPVNRYSTAQKIENRLSYWRQRLAPPLDRLDLPVDFPRSQARPFVGANVWRTLPTVLVQAVRDASPKLSVYPSTVYLAAFSLILARYAGREDFVLGVPFDERGRSEAETIDLFVNMLPVRVSVTKDVTFENLARTLQACLLEAMAKSVPFPDIVHALGESGARAPIFQQAFMYQNFVSEAARMCLERDLLAPICARLVHDIGQVGEYEIALEVIDVADQGRLVLKYNPDLYEAATASRLLDQVVHLLTNAIAYPALAVGQLSLFSDGERKALLDMGRGMVRSYPDDASLNRLFADRVIEAPERVAVRYDDVALTYRSLDVRSDCVAALLKARGVRKGDLVAICLERSVEFVVALLAVLKAGAAFLPLDPRLPEQRLAYMLADSGARLAVTARDAIARLPADVPRLMIDDTDWNCTGTGSPARSAAVGGDAAAYVLYTSGSSGVPKGVVVAHRALVAFLTAMISQPGIGPDDRFLALTTFSFDISLLELLSPLVTGAECVICPTDIARDAERLCALIEAVRPTLLQATPATWMMLLDAGWSNSTRTRLLCGGEAMTEALRTRLDALDCDVWNMYGPTEATIWSMVKRLVPGGATTLGRPIANTQVFVLDEDRMPVPIGVPGELWIAGDGLAQGYLNQPDLTAQRFVACPFGDDGSRMYGTGDVARWRNDGEIDFLGRVDSQVKIRGFRVELGEIETALMRRPGVAQAVVVAKANERGDQRLVAYVVVHERMPTEGAILRKGLREVLPDYMIPAAIVVLDALPKTPSGKIDRKKLPEPIAPARGVNADQLPVTVVEKRLAAIWRDVLGIEGIGIDDSFFDLGGHSLNGMQVVAKARELIGVEIPMNDLFEAPRIRDLALRIERFALRDIANPS